VDAVYIGGGFPEAYAERLAQNETMRRTLRLATSAGLPVFAECGGLMYLGRELRVAGTAYPMAGILDLSIEQTPKPQGHGYVSARVGTSNPFFGSGTALRGHEFHYSRVVGGQDVSASVLRLERGTGLGEGRDGIVAGRIWASYLHIHALGTPSWAPRFLALARTYQRERLGGLAACG
jgi:cobyrinic acid a,c-diamide synthase